MLQWHMYLDNIIIIMLYGVVPAVLACAAGVQLHIQWKSREIVERKMVVRLENTVLELFPHNRRAYDAVCCFLESVGKAAVIHPTGTGKSFIAFRLVLDNPQAEVLWLSPSEYIFRTQLENLRKSLSCLGRENKEEGSAPLKMEGFWESSHNLKEKRERFPRHLAKNLEFMTYSRLMLCADSFSAKNLDYIILDEFHRCGASEWGKGVRQLLSEHPEAKVLGLSATNVRYLDGQRDMAEELFGGCVASKMTLGEAVAEKILPAPRYVVSMYSYQKELERLKERIKNGRDSSLRKQNEELLEKLRRSLEQADGLEKVFAKHIKGREGKYIVFCSGKNHMEEMISHAGEWFCLVDTKPNIYQVSYDDTGAEKQFEFNISVNSNLYTPIGNWYNKFIKDIKIYGGG
ncbi:DEAD/DEAH box helicase [bacterium D16-51]|nr:DEAD/DEAH box helicase [bacterium D16-51]